MLNLIKKATDIVGITIKPNQLDGVVLDAKTGVVSASYTYAIPDGVFNGDELVDASFLSQQLTGLIRNIGGEKKPVYVSIAASLVRVMELPKLEKEQLQLALSSEAERFRAFENTEAIIDYCLLGETAQRKQRVLTAGVRKDTLEKVLQACRTAKIAPQAVSVDVVEGLRGFAGSGLLDAFRHQAGNNVCWGAIFAAQSRVRLVLFQGADIQEVRELQLSLSHLNSLEEAPFLLDDLVEEIQRTAKTLVPIMWFVEGISPSVLSGLSQRLITPVREMILPQAVHPSLDQVDLAAFGTAMMPLVSFPFEANLLQFRKGKLKAATPTSFEGGTSAAFTPTPLLKVGIASGALFLLVWLAFTILNIATANQLADMHTTETTKTAELNAKQQQLTILKKQSSIQAALLDTVQRIRTQNTVYQRLASDLRFKTPGQAWLLSLKAGAILEMQGKALRHQSVIALARSFDDVSYLTDVNINSIQQSLVGKVPVYEFKIGATVQPDASLLKDVELGETNG